MCLMVYIAAHGALRKVDWVEAAPAFYVADLSPDERRVDCQFRTGNVVYAGSYEGCGCGFQYGEYPADSYEPGELRERRESLDAFAKYLRAELSRVGTIEVFACWDGDQGLEPLHHRTLTHAALERDDFFFIKREHSDDLWGAVTFGKTRDELGRLLAAGVQFSSTPGTRYAYSNLGWALLGRAVENVTHQGYREYVTANVLQPLGMRSSVWEANEVPAGRLATGYRREHDALIAEPRDSDGAFAAAGGLYTSLHDIARYAAYQLAAYPPRDDPESGPVRRSTLREMHLGQRPARGLDKDVPVARMTDDGIVLAAAGYGFGWLAVTSCTEEVRIQHGGFEPGYFNWVVLLPRERVGFVALATSGPAGIESRFGVFEILRRGGLLAAPPPMPHPALAAMPARLAKLLASWDEALALRTFDPDSGKYSWSKEHAPDFERLTHEHGRCVPAGDSLVYGPLHAQTRFTCERGALVFDVLLSPATPPLVQYLEITEEFPADERTADCARRLAAAIEPAGQASSSALFAPALDRAYTQKKLARLALEYGACTVLDGSREVPHRPWPAQAQARYALRCSSGPLELTFTLDVESGAVTSFDAHPPRTFDATCWQ